MQGDTDAVCRCDVDCKEAVNIIANISTDDRREALVLISEAAAWSMNSAEVYKRMLDVVVDFVQADEGHMHLFDDSGTKVVRVASSGAITPEGMGEYERPLSIGRLRLLLNEQVPLVADYLRPNSEDIDPAESLAMGLKGAVSVPLLYDGKVVGMFSLCYRRRVEWDADGLSFLLAVGRMLGVSVMRIQSTRKAFELLVLDERKRLSIEIHDGISQHVGALALNAASILASYEEGDEEGLERDLKRFEVTSSKTMRMLRDEMLSLRIPLEESTGFMDGVRETLAAFEQNWGIAATLTCKGNVDSSMPVHVSLQMTRILNECLSNVIRHSRASSVSVAIDRVPCLFSMVVEDNGVGFDLEAVSPERLGLKIMKERASAVGGTCSIVSGERGTAICVDVPMTGM